MLAVLIMVSNNKSTDGSLISNKRSAFESNYRIDGSLVNNISTDNSN